MLLKSLNFVNQCAAASNTLARVTACSSRVSPYTIFQADFTLAMLYQDQKQLAITVQLGSGDLLALPLSPKWFAIVTRTDSDHAIIQSSRDCILYSKL